jgi:hypothetical protein
MDFDLRVISIQNTIILKFIDPPETFYLRHHQPLELATALSNSHRRQ